jgi:hypothetical protein
MSVAEGGSESALYIGLLECPLRKGYIEFEYTVGDSAGDLKEKIIDIWGDAFADRVMFVGGFLPVGRTRSSKAWSILVEDDDGAYLPLKDSDKIPLSAPPSKPSKLADPVQKYMGMETTRGRYDDRQPMPYGVIYDVDHTLEMADLIDLDSAEEDKSDAWKEHRLVLNIVREGYQVPGKCMMCV